MDMFNLTVTVVFKLIISGIDKQTNTFKLIGYAFRAHCFKTFMAEIYLIGYVFRANCFKSFTAEINQCS